MGFDMVRLSDWQTDKVTCPACKAILSLTVDVNIDADLSFGKSSGYQYANPEDNEDIEIVGKYVRRIPNIGLFPPFFNAHCGEHAFLSNGNFALKGIDNLELQVTDRRESVCLDSVMDKFNGELEEVFPDEMTSAYVRVIGESVDLVFVRRDLDFLYAVFPEARLYSRKGLTMLIAKNGDDICAIIMGIIFYNTYGPWHKAMDI